MRRGLPVVGLVASLIITVLFSEWEADWRGRNAAAERPAIQSVHLASALIPPTGTLLPITQSPVPSITPTLTETPPPTIISTRPISPLSTPTPVRPTATSEWDDALVRGHKAPTPPPPDDVNGVPIDKFVVMPDSVKENIHKIYERGLALGYNPRAFSKMGDSTIENPYFLTRFDEGPYKLGNYAYLQPVINYFAGSFSRQSMTVRVGLHSWSMLNPTWADKAHCQPNESPAACEFRLHKPVIVLIRLGANDADTPQFFKENLQQIISFTVQSGVIPVLGTKADRFHDPDNRFNNIIRQLAEENNVPLWDFDLVAQTLPGSGLGEDGVHMTGFFEHDYTLPEAFKRGHSVHNLTALIMLDKLWRELTQTKQ